MYIKVIPYRNKEILDSAGEWMFECDVYRVETVGLVPHDVAGEYDFNIWDGDGIESEPRHCLELRMWDTKGAYTSALIHNAQMYAMNNEGKTIDRFEA